MRLPRKRKMYFRKKKEFRILPFILASFAFSIFGFFYFVNARLTPTYLRYAEIQTDKIASDVINKAISSRTTDLLDVNKIIVELPSGNSNLVTTRLDTEIINRVRADSQALVQARLEEAEAGNLKHLPKYDNIKYDEESMQRDGGIVFFVPIGQAANIPLIGNLGPEIPIRFHVIGNVKSEVESSVTNFGINNAFVEVNIKISVNVQIIVPLASKSTTVEQTIPVTLALLKGSVPHIYNNGEGKAPSIEVPVKLPDDPQN